MTVTEMQPQPRPGEGGAWPDTTPEALPPPAPRRDRVARLTAEVDQARELLQLQDDPALTKVLSDAERADKRRRAERVRRRARRQQQRGELAEVARDGRRQRAEDRLARIDTDDAVWYRRAVSTRRRLTDPNVRLASLQRVHRNTTLALLAVMVAGIAWASVNVQHTVAGGAAITDPMFWLGFVVEPLISVPLVVLLAVRGAATSWGRQFGGRRVHAVEAVLLVTTTALNAGPYAPGVGHWVSGPVLLAHLVPPAMVATAVVLQPIVGSFLAGVLVDAHVEVSEIDAGRMSADAAELIELVLRVRQALAAGDLAAADGARFPSISAIQRHFAIGKQKAQAVHDALTRLG